MSTVLEGWWKCLLAKLGCVVCTRFVATGVPPSLHHMAPGSSIRSTFAMVPLCEPHHQGPRGFHSEPRKFIMMFRPPFDHEVGVLVWLLEDLAAYLRRRVPFLGRA